MGDGIHFIQKHAGTTDLLQKIAAFGVTMSIGSLFLFKMQERFGALQVTLVTTLRKLVSVVVSVILFGHSMNALQWASALMVFLANPISDFVVKNIIAKDSSAKKDTSGAKKDASATSPKKEKDTNSGSSEVRKRKISV